MARYQVEDIVVINADSEDTVEVEILSVLFEGGPSRVRRHSLYNVQDTSNGRIFSVDDNEIIDLVEGPTFDRIEHNNFLSDLEEQDINIPANTTPIGIPIITRTGGELEQVNTETIVDNRHFAPEDERIFRDWIRETRLAEGTDAHSETPIATEQPDSNMVIGTDPFRFDMAAMQEMMERNFRESLITGRTRFTPVTEQELLWGNPRLRGDDDVRDPIPFSNPLPETEAIPQPRRRDPQSIKRFNSRDEMEATTNIFETSAPRPQTIQMNPSTIPRVNSFNDIVEREMHIRNATPPVQGPTGEHQGREIILDVLLRGSTSHREGGIKTRDYTPRAGDLTRRLIHFQVNGLNFIPHLIPDGSYIFFDDANTEWVNQHQERQVSLIMGRSFDTFGQAWTTRTTLNEYKRNSPANRGIYEQLTSKKSGKSRKKLRRKHPIPEIKDEKYYASKEYIA